MSKEPAIDHSYDDEKDQFNIKMKHFGLDQKWLQRELVDVCSLKDSTKSRCTKARQKKDPIKIPGSKRSAIELDLTWRASSGVNDGCGHWQTALRLEDLHFVRDRWPAIKIVATSLLALVST
jgi:hypothetical protein